jgi:hypothetical protein
MFGDYFVDLDELVLRCRDEQARQYIAEAVACYRAGAFRACIVMTWTAVAFDFIHKLRELELSGDANAEQQLQQFENIRAAHDISRSLEFERKMLTTVFCKIKVAHAHFVWCLDQALRRTRERSRSK